MRINLLQMAPFFRVNLGPSRSNSYIGTFYLSLSLITILGDCKELNKSKKPFPHIYIISMSTTENFL